MTLRQCRLQSNAVSKLTQLTPSKRNEPTQKRIGLASIGHARRLFLFWRLTTKNCKIMKSDILLPPTNGIHTWLPSAAHKCRMGGMSAQETINHLSSLSYRRKVSLREITQAVNLVFDTEIATTDRPRDEKPIGWLKTATDKIFAEWKTTEQDLMDMSDVHPSDIDQRELIRSLFPQDNALVCIGSAFNRFTTAPLAEHHQIDQCQFIVPCYMTAREGITTEGKPSCRALSNTGERRYIVLDFDDPPPEHHASIIRWMMGSRAPVLVIQTGGKSLHAWYAPKSQDRDAKFWKLAVMAGADPAIRQNRGQAVRLPMGQRDNGKVQSVLYFNPNNLPA